ncbi:MAG: hypothetical protein H7199_05870 [Burkholderiales bacterium]|nr:hypothetical protein [Flavobacterium sp.]
MPIKSPKYNTKRSNLCLNKIATAIVALCLFLFSLAANAQCAMCRAALESEGNAQKAQAVNDGIVYLMVIPYILVGGIGYAVYRLNKKKN